MKITFKYLRNLLEKNLQTQLEHEKGYYWIKFRDGHTTPAYYDPTDGPFLAWQIIGSDNIFSENDPRDGFEIISRIQEP